MVLKNFICSMYCVFFIVNINILVDSNVVKKFNFLSKKLIGIKVNIFFMIMMCKLFDKNVLINLKVLFENFCVLEVFLNNK